MDATHHLGERLAQVNIRETTTSTSVAQPLTSTTEPTETTTIQITATVKEPKKKYECRATVLKPRFDLLRPGEPVFFDAEHAKYKKAGEKERHRLGRPAVLNSAGQVILDIYCYYNNEDGVEKICPPKEFNVWWPDLKAENGAKPAQKVEAWLKDIFDGRTVVVHGGRNDLTAFYLEPKPFENSDIVDTQDLFAGLRYETDGHPGLEACAKLVLGIEEFDHHNPVADAEITRLLYLRKFPEQELQKATELTLPNGVPRTITNAQRGRGGGGAGRGRGHGRGRGGAVQHYRQDSSSTDNTSSSASASTGDTSKSTLFPNRGNTRGSGWRGKAWRGN